MKKNMLPDFRQRQDDSAAAKKAIFGKFRATPGPDDAAVTERRRAREVVLAERAARAAQREAAKRAHEAEAERVEREVAILAEQKAARDERYAARKAEP